MTIPITISSESTEKEKIVETKALLDTGAGGKFIDQNYVNHLKLETRTLGNPLKVYNVDGTPNKRGTITKYVNVELTINGKPRRHNVFITGLGKQKIILGFPWFKSENPDIDWEKGTLVWRKDKSKPMIVPKVTIEEEEDEELWKTRTLNPIDNKDDDEIVVSYLEEIEDDELWINAKTNVAVE